MSFTDVGVIFSPLLSTLPTKVLPRYSTVAKRISSSLYFGQSAGSPALIQAA